MVFLLNNGTVPIPFFGYRKELSFKRDFSAVIGRLQVWWALQERPDAFHRASRCQQMESLSAAAGCHNRGVATG